MLPDSVLRAARRWLELLPDSSPERCRALLTAHREYSDIAPSQYDAAYSWLHCRGLLADLASHTPSAQRIFEAAVSEADVAWFRDADLLLQGSNDLPVDALRAAEALGIGNDEALAHVRRAWGKVDTAERERIGAAGEAALVRLLEAASIGRVEHVAAISDGFGYDIALHAAHYSAHIEVKATTRRGRLAVHLSRNEYEVMRQDAMWVLVAVRLTEDLQPAATGAVASEWIAAHVPADRSSHGRWSSCVLDVPPSAIRPGIPNIAPVLGTSPASLMLMGIPAWPG